MPIFWTADVPVSADVACFSGNLAKVGGNLIHRILFGVPTAYERRIIGTTSDYLDQGSRLNGERGVRHLHFEGTLNALAPLSTINTEASEKLVDGDGTTICSTVAIALDVPGFRDPNGVVRSNNGTGAFAPTSEGAWGTQSIEAHSLGVSHEGYFHKSLGSCCSDLTVSPDEFSFTVHKNDFVFFVIDGWTYSASGHATTWRIRGTRVSDTVFKVVGTMLTCKHAIRGPYPSFEAAPLQEPDEYTIGVNSSTCIPNAGAGPRAQSVLFDQLVAELRLWRPRGDVAQKALDDYREVHSNSIENATQAEEGLRSILPLDAAVLAFDGRTRALNDPVGGMRQLARAAASLYLWYRYVLIPGFSDVAEWISAVKRLSREYGKAADSPRRLRGSEKYSVEALGFTLNVRVAELLSVTPYARDSLVDLALRFGFEIGLGQAWDLVPFSFVEDWFLNRAGTLRAIDWFFYGALLRLHVRVMSQKTSYEGPFDDGFWQGSISASYYVREVTLTKPSFVELLPLPRCVPISDWAPVAAALAIVR